MHVEEQLLSTTCMWCRWRSSSFCTPLNLLVSRGTLHCLSEKKLFLCSPSPYPLQHHRPLSLLSPLFLWQTERDRLASRAAQTPLCAQVMPLIHFWIASIATATLLDTGRIIAVERYRRRTGLCRHTMFPSVFYSFYNNSQHLSWLFVSCQALLWYIHRIPYFNTKISLLSDNSQLRAQISYDNQVSYVQHSTFIYTAFHLPFYQAATQCFQALF